jgi:hypothetical protein
VKRAAVASGRELAVALPRLADGLVPEHGDDRVVCGPETLQPVEEMSGEIHR